MLALAFLVDEGEKGQGFLVFRVWDRCDTPSITTTPHKLGYLTGMIGLYFLLVIIVV